MTFSSGISTQDHVQDKNAENEAKISGNRHRMPVYRNLIEIIRQERVIVGSAVVGVIGLYYLARSKNDRIRRHDVEVARAAKAMVYPPKVPS